MLTLLESLIEVVDNDDTLGDETTAPPYLAVTEESDGRV